MRSFCVLIGQNIARNRDKWKYVARRYSALSLTWSKPGMGELSQNIAQYRDVSVSRSSIIWLSLRLLQITELLAIDKSQHCLTSFNNC